MPYAETICGIYKIVNKANGKAYVGQSQNVKKRIAEHFRLLRLGKHINPRLQNAFNKYGEENFEWSLEAICADPIDLDVIENAFISGDARFLEPLFYNIANFAKAPMRGKTHSEEIRKRISAGRRAALFDFKSEKYRQNAKLIGQKRALSNPEYLAKVKFIVENPDMTYAARGRVVGMDTSTVRKVALNYVHLKGEL